MTDDPRGTRERVLSEMAGAAEPVMFTDLRWDRMFYNATAMPFLGVEPADSRDEGRGLYSPIQPDSCRAALQDLFQRGSTRSSLERRGSDGVLRRYAVEVRLVNEGSSVAVGALIRLRLSRPA